MRKHQIDYRREMGVGFNHIADRDGRVLCGTHVADCHSVSPLPVNKTSDVCMICRELKKAKTYHKSAEELEGLLGEAEELIEKSRPESNADFATNLSFGSLTNYANQLREELEDAKAREEMEREACNECNHC